MALARVYFIELLSLDKASLDTHGTAPAGTAKSLFSPGEAKEAALSMFWHLLELGHLLRPMSAVLL